MTSFFRSRIAEIMMNIQTSLSESSQDPNKVIESTIEIPSIEKNDKILLSATRIFWRVFKWIIFIICTVFFIYQALEFYSEFYTYPTTNNIAIISPDHLKLPAVTVCNLNMVNRTYFCGQYPNLCAKPNNLEEFCQKQPVMCVGNISELQIPRVGYYTNSLKNMTEMRDAFQQLVFEANLKENNMFYGETESWRITYVISYQYFKFARCYSYNLQIFSTEEPLTAEASREAIVLGQMYEKKEESLFPWYEPQTFLSVHSPVVPSNPISQGQSLNGGHQYELYINFEEEHLLPHPYPTDCTDYDALWIKNNKTGARSQEMCREYCRKSLELKCLGCVRIQTMYSYNWQSFCPFQTDRCKDKKLTDKSDLCEKDCKPNCLKLKYTYRVNERTIAPWSIRGQFHIDRNVIRFTFRLRNHDVTVVSHVPLYNEWELFSYIGGLMGCWLGISVWAFVGIIEDSFRTIIKLKKA